MVAEFWPGWFDHWGEQHHKMEVNTVTERVSNILRAGASINFYMFHGRLDTNSLVILIYNSLIATHNVFGSADPSSMRDYCHM